MRGVGSAGSLMVLLVVALPVGAADAEAPSFDAPALCRIAGEYEQEVTLLDPAPGELHRWGRTDRREALLFRPDAGPFRLRLRLPVQRDGWCRIRGDHVVGPWKPGRFGLYRLLADGVRMPGQQHGWYSPGPPGHWPKARLHVQPVDWGVVFLRQPDVLLTFFRDHDTGTLFGIDRLILEPAAEAKLSAEDRERVVPVRSRVADAPPDPLLVVQASGASQAVPVWLAGTQPMIDGRLTEWEWDTGGVELTEATMDANGRETPPIDGDADLSASVRLQWDSRALYVAVRVRDDEPSWAGAGGDWRGFWEYDGLAVFITVPRWLLETSRCGDEVGEEHCFGLNLYPDLGPRLLPAGSRYACGRTEEGYAIEAAISFESLTLTPRAGDRLKFGLIAVDRDPSKPEGKRFGQYLWRLGRGEIRLLDGGGTGAELIPERRQIGPRGALRFVGTADVYGGERLVQAVELIRLDTGSAVASWPHGQRLAPGNRYRLHGAAPVAGLVPGRYDLRLRFAGQ